MKPYMSLKNFSFKFDVDADYFFHDVNFSIPKPGLIFVVGKNGVGKSVFFRCLQGIVQSHEYESGTLQIQEKMYDLSSVVDQQHLHMRSRALRQNFNEMLVLKFTGLENIACAKFYDRPNFSFAKISSKEIEYAKLFSIPLKKRVALLSDGQRQMLALLMTLQKPIDILLLDDPIAALDVKNSHAVLGNLQKLAQDMNLCIMCISHDKAMVEQYADFIITIHENEAGKRVVSMQKNSEK